MQTNRIARSGRPAGILVALVVLTACASPGAGLIKTAPQPTARVAEPEPQPAAAQAGQQQVQVEAQADYVGKMSLAPNHGYSGTAVTATGEGLPPSTRMELVWGTASGEWNLEGEFKEAYHGRKFTPATEPIATIVTDGQGRFSHTFTVPEDFGFAHDIRVVQDGVIRNQANFNLDMEASVWPTSGPQGTPITIEVKGLGSGKYESFWKVFYDNKDAGFLSATTTRGTARAVIPAVGQPGKHVIQIIEGAFTFSYRNIQESPFPHLKPFEFMFEITEGPPVLPQPLARQALPLEPGAPPPGDGLAIWPHPRSGPVGTPVQLAGRSLAPDTAVELVWYQMVGNRVSGSGWVEKAIPLGTVTADAQGAFQHSFTAPDDLGGAHRLEALVQGQPVAKTYFDLKPSVVGITPTSGPAGTTFHITLKGVGWTETANIYTIVYDNAYIGYACGFTSQGTVNIYLKATGEPGWHFVDLYPSIYKGKEPLGVETFRMPQLTFADDHPNERLPAFHFAFQVTE